MTLTGSAMECERGWKDWTHVVTLRRNCLLHDRATKLVKLYHHLHPREQARQKETDDSDAPPDAASGPSHVQTYDWELLEDDCNTERVMERTVMGDNPGCP